MLSIRILRTSSATALFLLVLMSETPVSKAQSRHLNGWHAELAYLQSAALEEQCTRITHILTEIGFWIRLHPQSTVELPPVPPQPWTAEQTRSLIAALRETVAALSRQDNGRPFELGVTEVSVTAEISPLSPVAATIHHSEIEDLHMPDIGESVRYLPGIGIDHNSARGQSGIMIRGFDTRQVGLYVDGIPVYVPFDGFVDVSRFLTGVISEIEVAKGYSSPLRGPNGLGGAVNLVTRLPEKRFDADAAIGTGSGNGLESSLHLGGRWQRLFLQAGVDWRQADHYPLSGQFITNRLQPGFNRTNSDRRDASYSGRLGWTPRNLHQYVVSYSNQKSDYGTPPYSGQDVEHNKPKFWRWPYWNKEMYYFNSNTGLGEMQSLRFRAYYDRFRNNMTGFTDETYSSLASVNPYDDHSVGASAEFSTRRLARHSIGVSFFIKDDIHKESKTTFSKGGAVMEPWRTHHDRMISIGFQDVITISSRMRATVGLSADLLDALEAQDLKTTVAGEGGNAVTRYSVEPFSCAEAGSCLVRVWDYNPLASFSYSLSDTGSLFFAVTQKSHFPTLKDRYSYRYGRAIPNPALQPEHARNWTLGYSHAFGLNTVLQAELFRSDVYDAIQNAVIPAEYENQCPSMGGGMCQQSVNIGREVHQGFELTLRSTPLSRLSLNANYSFLNWTIPPVQSVPGVHPVRAPKHKVVAVTNVRLPWKSTLLTTIRHEHGTVTTNDAGTIIPASNFVTADLGLIALLGKGAAIQAGVGNLFDSNYYYQEGFPEPGRTWYTKLRYRF